VFVGVPLLIIAVVVAMLALFAWLVGEQRSLDQYMAAIRSGTAESSEQGARGLFEYIQNTKRWQTMFDMTQQVAFNREQFLQDNPGFGAQVLEAFEDKKTDVKTRRYLALILGLIGEQSAVPALTAALKEPDAILVRNCVWVLGRVGGKSAIRDLAPFLTSEKAELRLMAVFSIGSIGNPEDSAEVIPFLKRALADSEPMIQWSAALLLARRGDGSGKDVLIELVRNDPQPSAGGKRYVDLFGRMKVEDDPNHPAYMTDEKKTACRIAAVQQLAALDPQGSVELLKQVSLNDANLRVRSAALKALNAIHAK
jgi:hypothetical protein